MGLDRDKARKCFMEAGGNLPEAMAIYIMNNGCNGFACKSCILGKVCDHFPAHSKEVAFDVLRIAYAKREKSKD